MAHIWIEEETGAWRLAPLDKATYAVVSQREAPLNPLCDSTARLAGIALLRVAESATADWLLMAEADMPLFVNGAPLPLGIRKLRDRDEILIPAAAGESSGFSPPANRIRLFFSTERLARIEPLPGSDHEILCLRCRQTIRPGSLAVQCPNPACDHWYHEEGELLCWSYSPSCAICDQSTALDADYRWTPEDL